MPITKAATGQEWEQLHLQASLRMSFADPEAVTTVVSVAGKADQACWGRW
jgi:hypothetical protein